MSDKQQIERVIGKGIQYRERKNSLAVYWTAPAGSHFQPRTVNLTRFVKFPRELEREADRLNEEVKKSKIGAVPDHDYGTVSYILRRYEMDKESPFHELSAGSAHTYMIYLKRLRMEVGKVRLDSIIGTDLIKWHNIWSEERTLLAAGKMCFTVLKAVVKYAISCRIEGAAALMEVMKATSPRLPNPKARDQFISADEVVKLRQAAHAAGRPMMALTYAIVFETFLRLYDTHQELDWRHISDGLILQYIPTKTVKKSGAKVIINLASCPMVMEELKPYLANGKPLSGPVIKCDIDDRRYSPKEFANHFKRHRAKANIDPTVWARDLRASGITEARLYDASITDLGQMAGHSTSVTTATVYDRAKLAAAERVAVKRQEGRQLVLENA
jgi:integrase